MTPSYQAVMRAPFGKLGLRIENGMLVAIDFLPASTPEHPPDSAFANAVCRALTAYFEDGTPLLEPHIRPAGTPFQQRVWAALRGIPAGTVLSYGELAERVGSGARAVANACGANPIPLVIPCHRVVARHGPGGFMQGRTPAALEIKHWLLQHERSRSTAAG